MIISKVLHSEKRDLIIVTYWKQIYKLFKSYKENIILEVKFIFRKKICFCVVFFSYVCWNTDLNFIFNSKGNNFWPYFLEAWENVNCEYGKQVGYNYIFIIIFFLLYINLQLALILELERRKKIVLFIQFNGSI